MYKHSTSVKNNYANILLYDYFNVFSIPYKSIYIDYKLVLSKCNIIAVAGDSGSGKSTLTNRLMNIFGGGNVLKLETDRYHKWERGDINYKTYSHLNPYANHLETMAADVFNLKIGNEIYQVDYDHHTGRFTEKEHIKSKNNIILCGLHTLYVDKLNMLYDIKIFMDTERELITKWKIERDMKDRNYTEEQIVRQIKSRELDYMEYIDNQKKHADIIIRFYENGEPEIKCKLTIQNKLIYEKLMKYLIKYNYVVSILKTTVTIFLKKNIYDMYMQENISQLTEIATEDYYSEILILLIIYIYY